MNLSADDIMRELERIPHGVTLREGAPAKRGGPPAAPRWEGVIPPPMDLPCAAGCGNRVEHPGICHPCGAARESEAAQAEFASAIDTLPEWFRWTTPGAPELDARVSSVAHTGARPRVMAERVAADMLSGAAKVVLVRGPRDAGKTSFICAVAQIIVSTARDEWIRFERRKVGGRTDYQEPRICGMARGLFYAAARDILPPDDRGVDAPQPKFGRLIKSRIAIIDELGQEIEARDDTAATSKRLKATSDIICHHWDTGSPLLAATWMTDQDIYKYYKGGVQKRLIKAEQVRVVELNGKAI